MQNPNPSTLFQPKEKLEYTKEEKEYSVQPAALMMINNSILITPALPVKHFSIYKERKYSAKTYGGNTYREKNYVPDWEEEVTKYNGPNLGQNLLLLKRHLLIQWADDKLTFYRYNPRSDTWEKSEEKKFEGFIKTVGRINYSTFFVYIEDKTKALVFVDDAGNDSSTIQVKATTINAFAFSTDLFATIDFVQGNKCELKIWKKNHNSWDIEATLEIPTAPIPTIAWLSRNRLVCSGDEGALVICEKIENVWKTKTVNYDKNLGYVPVIHRLNNRSFIALLLTEDEPQLTYYIGYQEDAHQWQLTFLEKGKRVYVLDENRVLVQSYESKQLSIHKIKLPNQQEKLYPNRLYPSRYEWRLHEDFDTRISAIGLYEEGVEIRISRSGGSSYTRINIIEPEILRVLPSLLKGELSCYEALQQVEDFLQAKHAPRINRGNLFTALVSEGEEFAVLLRLFPHAEGKRMELCMKKVKVLEDSLIPEMEQHINHLLSNSSEIMEWNPKYRLVFEDCIRDAYSI